MSRETMGFGLLGPSIKYVALFWINFDPLLLSHFVIQLGTPVKYVTHLGPPIFSSTHIHRGLHMSLHGVYFNSRGVLFWEFCMGFLSGRFCPGRFLSFPLLS